MKRLATILVAGIIMFSCVFSINGANLIPFSSITVLPHFRSWDHVGYQGRVTQSDGNPISDGSHVFIFTLHDHETASSPVWTETRTETTTDGLLSLKLGEVTPLVLNDFGSAGQDTARVLYLEINVDGETITPRTEIIAAPFALVSARLMGDVETSDGTILVREQTTGDTAFAAGSDPSKALNAYLRIKGGTQSNISMESDASTSVIGIEHEDIGVRMHSSDEGAGAGLTLLDGTGDSTIYAMNKAELVEAVASEVHTTSLSPEGLVISNIGSSGVDGIVIQGGNGLGGKIALRKLQGGETIQTEIISMSLEGSQPISIKADNALPLDPSIFRLEYDSFGRVVERFDGTPTSPGDSSEFNSSGLRLYDGLDRVILDNDNGGKMSLGKLQSGETIPTEIISMSLQGTDPPISVRMPDALPLDIPLTTYEYDMIGRRIVKVCRSEAGQVGDSSHSSSTGLHVFDFPNEFKYDFSGISFLNPTGSPFSVTPNGDIQSQGNSELALGAGNAVGIGGTFPGVKLFVDGDVCHTGILGPCSDKRFKMNIFPINNSLKKILALAGVTFDWDQQSFPDMNFTDRKQIGLIAQDVMKIIPEIVGQGKDGYYFVDYSKVTPILIEAVKEQQSEISELKREMAILKEMVLNFANEKAKTDKITLSSK